MSADETYAKIWTVVKKIPRGCVATYGQIAREAGFPKQPRLTGYALHKVPQRLKLPWHRVINAQGKISFPPRSEPYRLQRKLLEQEGVVFVSGRVNLARYLWQPRSESPLLD